MVTIEKEMFTIFREVVKKEIEVCGHNSNGWMKKLQTNLYRT